MLEKRADVLISVHVSPHSGIYENVPFQLQVFETEMLYYCYYYMVNLL